MASARGARDLAVQVGVAVALLGAFYGVPKAVWARASSSGSGGTPTAGLSVEERLAKEPTAGHYWGISEARRGHDANDDDDDDDDAGRRGGR